MSHLPSDDYIKSIEKMVDFFDRKGRHDTCFHEELATIRKMQEKAERKQQPKEIKNDGE